MNNNQFISDRKKDAFDIHLELSWKIESMYKERDTDPDAIKKTIDYCKIQIAIAEEAKNAWIKECDNLGDKYHLMPTHKGYDQLCIILEKEKKFNEVISLATQAKIQGWAGDWDKRIDRCKTKLETSAKS